MRAPAWFLQSNFGWRRGATARLAHGDRELSELASREVCDRLRGLLETVGALDGHAEGSGGDAGGEPVEHEAVGSAITAVTSRSRSSSWSPATPSVEAGRPFGITRSASCAASPARWMTLWTPSARRARTAPSGPPRGRPCEPRPCSWRTRPLRRASQWNMPAAARISPPARASRPGGDAPAQGRARGGRALTASVPVARAPPRRRPDRPARARRADARGPEHPRRPPQRSRVRRLRHTRARASRPPPARRTITAAGQRHLERAACAQRQAEDELFADLDGPERKELEALLVSLRDSLADEPACA